VGSYRRAERLDWLLIVGRSRLEQVLGSTPGTTTAIVPTGALKLQAPAPATGLTNVAEDRQGVVHRQTCSVAYSTSTGELHECVCLPFAVRTGLDPVNQYADPKGLGDLGITEELARKGADSSTQQWHPIQ
jgi:hypothetical protein